MDGNIVDIRYFIKLNMKLVTEACGTIYPAKVSKFCLKVGR
jgi:hypothetical protein